MQMDNGRCCFSGGGDAEGTEASSCVSSLYADKMVNALRFASLEQSWSIYIQCEAIWQILDGESQAGYMNRYLSESNHSKEIVKKICAVI